VHIYRNGQFIGKTPVRLGRQDVLQAKPQFGDVDTGWRLDMDFKRLPTGIHRIDVFLEQKPGVLRQLGTRQIAIMDAQQQTPALLPQRPLPPSLPATDTLDASIDSPKDQSSFYYNPLVPLWHNFRGLQVVKYLQYFHDVVGQSCLASTPRYTHQIIPFTNPSWDANKFAIDASLRRMGNIRLGVSLYGEPTYGTSFSKWYARTTHDGYGITEFHPLKAMAGPAMQAMLKQHAEQGAEFLSFFMDARWRGQLTRPGPYMFSFDPENPKFGSDTLYRSVQQVLAQPPGAASQANTSALASANP
jgi:hypothetical protein